MNVTNNSFCNSGLDVCTDNYFIPILITVGILAIIIGTIALRFKIKEEQ